jgi:LmbE family N-acetylglucosaminyl deacetylase
MKILAIGAHYDDVEIGCGGFLLKRVDKGDEIIILTLTESGYTNANNDFTRQAILAKNEAEVAAKLIGAKLISMNKPTNQLIHNEAFSYEFDKIIEKYKPDIVLTHWGGDFHSDHAAVSLSSLRASRRINTILLYRSNWYLTEANFNGNYFVDISLYLNKKIEVIKTYKSVLDPINYSWIDFIKQQNQYEGSRIGVSAAECFHCIKTVE